MARPTADRNDGRPKPQPILAPNWFIGLVPREYWNVYKTFFIYELDFLPLNANATATGSIQIQADSHFLCVAGVALVTITANTTIINSESNASASGKLVTIVDAGSGAPLTQVPVALDNWFGTGQRPAIWAIPKLFKASGSINVTIQDIFAAQHNVRLSFWGIRIYPNVPASTATGT